MRDREELSSLRERARHRRKHNMYKKIRKKVRGARTERKKKSKK